MEEIIKKIGKYCIVDSILIKSITSPETLVQTCSYENIKIIAENPNSVFSYANTSDILQIPINENKVILNKGDKIFFHKGCNVLREKVRDYTNRNGISVTVKRENANIEFVSYKTLNCYLDTPEDDIYPVVKENFCEFIKLNYGESLKHLYDSVLKLTCKYIFVSKMPHYLHYMFLATPPGRFDSKNVIAINSKLGLKKLMDDINPSGCSISEKISNYYCKIINPEDFGVINSIVKGSGKSNIYLQDQINRLINEDSVIVDKAMYLNLELMLSSGQESDAQVAVEIMANSNLDKSLGRIMFLLKNNYYKINGFKCCTHVNFKSLISYIGLSPIYLSTDKIIDILIDKELLTEDYFKDLLPIIKDDVQHKISMTSGFKHFKVNRLSCSDEILNTINKLKEENYAGNRESISN